jgi:phage terminase small subunit
MVFQSPQLSQRPDHLDETAPQDWQTKVEALAIRSFWREPRFGARRLT